MKLFATLIAALALLAGFTGGMRAYSVSADAGPTPVRPVSAPHYPQAQPVRPGIVFRYAPCRPPAHRQGKACVTQVTRTVTLPAATVAAPPAAAVPAQAPRPATSPTRHPATSAPRPTSGGGGDDGDGDHDGGGGGGHDD
jgi:hypothetical protein